MTFPTPANPAQLEAITTTDGSLLIIAGPGPRKTFTLVKRTAYPVYHTGKTSGLSYHYLDKDNHATQQTMTTFDAIVARIEAQCFAIPARPGKRCEGCDMRHYCNATNWRFRNLEK